MATQEQRQLMNAIDSDAGAIIKHLFVRKLYRDHHLQAPLLLEREGYLRHLLSIGRSRIAVTKDAATLLHIVRDSELMVHSQVCRADITKSANRWLEAIRSAPKPSRIRSTRYYHKVAAPFFRFLGIYGKKRSSSWFDEYLDGFQAEVSKKIQHETARRYEGFVRSFLGWVSPRKKELHSIAIVDVDDYMTAKQSEGWKPKTYALLCTSLRAFFRYAEESGKCDGKLSLMIQVPRRVSRPQIRQVPTWNQIRKRISSLDDTKPSECQAKAIFLLAATYGLRSCEISRLTLDDFDWQNEVMTVRRAKRGGLQQFPIQDEVGAAITRYLLNARPVSEIRTLFLTFNTPHRAHVNLSSSMHPVLNATSIFSRPYGLHTLRRACATELLRKGTSLQDIAGLLGHRDLGSVSLYARSDSRALRKVANMSLKGVLS